MDILIVADVLNGHNGTFKIITNIAHGFKEKHKIKLIFYGKSDDYKNVADLISDIDYEILMPTGILAFIEKQVKSIITKKHSNFKTEDIPSIFAQFSLYKYLRKINFFPDIIIFTNVFSSFSLLKKNKFTKNMVILHEAPVFDDFNIIFRTALHKYLDVLNRKSLFVSISELTTEKTEKYYNYKIITRPPIGFISHGENYKKEKYILLDTRWTLNRDPMFIAKIAPMINNVKIIMHGIILDKSLKNELINTIRKNQYNIEIIYNDDSSHLATLYEKALIVLRWNGVNETGNSVAFLDAISYDCIPIIDKTMGVSQFISDNISSDLVVNKDEHEIAYVINRLIAEQNYYDVMLSRVKECKGRFSWEQYSENLIKDILH